eukprot:11167504-Lingulodinium_polyedra.AAC.1
MQLRLSRVIDHSLQPTQYGFRKKRGTADAIQYVRRVVDKGESTQTKTDGSDGLGDGLRHAMRGTEQDR